MNTFGNAEVEKLLSHFRHILSDSERHKAISEWIHYKHAVLRMVQAHHEIKQTEDEIASRDEPEIAEFELEQVTEVPAEVIQVQSLQENKQLSLYQLCTAMIREKEVQGLNNICLLLAIMIDLSPSNAHVERMVKAMNHIKTTERVGLSQVRLNNLFRVSTNSPTGTNFNRVTPKR